MGTNTRIKPQHKVCDHNVEVPTILVEPLKAGGKPEVFVQWFGEARGIDLGEMQFRFPVPIPPDNLYWMGHPEFFYVVLLGQVKDWPRQDVIRSVADSVARGNTDARIIWLASSHCRTGSEPTSFVTPMNIMLADGICGIITPRKYYDPSVLGMVPEINAILL